MTKVTVSKKINQWLNGEKAIGIKGKELHISNASPCQVHCPYVFLTLTFKLGIIISISDGNMRRRKQWVLGHTAGKGPGWDLNFLNWNAGRELNEKMAEERGGIVIKEDAQNW